MEALETAFHEKGIIHLKSLVPKKALDDVKKSILAELGRLKLKTNGKLSSAKLQSLPFFQQITSLSQMVKVGSELDKLFSNELMQIMTDLTHSPKKSFAPSPQLLLSFPHKEKWSLKSLNWHLDMTVPKKDEVTGVQAFVLIEDVRSRGGATLALAGSHRLHYQAPNKSAHAILRDNPIFSKLFTTDADQEGELIKPHIINGVEVSIVEMYGKAGDVFLMDMRVLHSPSINSTKNIRMMATSRFIK